jgi:Xaa-Pro aminopeptidase
MKITILSLILLISSLLPQSVEVFSQRRETILQQLHGRSAMILFTASIHMRNGDVAFDFRPDNDYWYLTGHDEPGGILMMISNDLLSATNLDSNNEILFVLPRNPKIEVWTGRRLGIEGVKRELGFNSSEPVDSFEVRLKNLIPSIDTLYTNITSPSRSGIPVIITDILDNYDLTNIEQKSVGDFTHSMRHVKTDEEVMFLQKAIDITGEALKEAMMLTKPGLKENNIEAAIEFIYRDFGCERPGFPSIIGSGPNSTILHYIKNNRMMEEGDLLLMDVGAEYNMYTADISRTIPVNGRYSEPQAKLYSYVLEAQQTVFDSVRVGMTIKDLNMIAKEYLSERGFGKYFIHGIGHWLGLDVHDVGGRQTAIKTGSVFTIEPGIYISEDDTTADERYRGIGIRIEDVVLMTEDGPVWLSKRIPKKIKEIERIMRRKAKRIR